MTLVTVMYVSSTYKAMTFARTHRNAASSAGGIRGERMQNLGECYRSKEEKKRKREKKREGRCLSENVLCAKRVRAQCTAMVRCLNGGVPWYLLADRRKPRSLQKACRNQETLLGGCRCNPWVLSRCGSLLLSASADARIF